MTYPPKIIFGEMRKSGVRQIAPTRLRSATLPDDAAGSTAPDFSALAIAVLYRRPRLSWRPVEYNGMHSASRRWRIF